jgi:hypothetical protein
MKNMMIRQVSDDQLVNNSFDPKATKIKNPWETQIPPKAQLTSNLQVVSSQGINSKLNKRNSNRADSLHNMYHGGNPRKLNPIEK